MSWSQVQIAEPEHKQPSDNSTDESQILVEATGRKPAILDMGEASREQGFRLNGCR